MEMDIDKIQYYRKNPLDFLEKNYNIKLLPYQEYFFNKMWKENKIYIPLSCSYSDNLYLTILRILVKETLKKGIIE